MCDFFFLMLTIPPRSTLFPYTTLFRSYYRVKIIKSEIVFKYVILKYLDSYKLTTIRALLNQICLAHKFSTNCFPILNVRSEEHTSELQSRFDIVCRLLLEKKKFISSIF